MYTTQNFSTVPGIFSYTFGDIISIRHIMNNVDFYRVISSERCKYMKIHNARCCCWLFFWWPDDATVRPCILSHTHSSKATCNTIIVSVNTNRPPTDEHNNV